MIRVSWIRWKGGEIKRKVVLVLETKLTAKDTKVNTKERKEKIKMSTDYTDYFVFGN
jgi:uncharacterized protein YjaG (DUF416 family)